MAVRLGEVDNVHPVPGPALAIARAGQEAIDQPLIGVVAGVVQKHGQFFRRGLQSREIETHAANQRAAVRPRRMGKGRSPSLANTNASIGLRTVPPLGSAGTGGRTSGLSDQ